MQGHNQGEPMTQQSYYERGTELLDGGEYAAALEQFERALRLGIGDIAAIHLCRAQALRTLTRWHDALQSVNSALEIEPYFAAAYLERGNIWMAQRQHERATQDYTMTIYIEPHDAQAHYLRAQAHTALGHHAAAEGDLTRALALEPGLIAAYLARARARKAQHKWEGAVADMSWYLRSGGGRADDSRSELQGTLLLWRGRRWLWRLLRRG